MQKAEKLKISALLKSRNNEKLFEIGILIIFVIFYRPPILKTVGHLFYATVEVLQNMKEFNRNLNASHAGETILPTSVQEMLSLLRKHDVGSFQITEHIRTSDHGFIYQRLVESAWPRKISETSKIKITFISDIHSLVNCEPLECGREVALVLCD
jgi:hypothetical protein